MLRRRHSEVGQWRLCGKAGQVRPRRRAARRGSGVAGEDGGRQSRGRQLPPSLLSAHTRVLASVRAHARALLSVHARVLALQLASARTSPPARRPAQPPGTPPSSYPRSRFPKTPPQTPVGRPVDPASAPQLASAALLPRTVRTRRRRALTSLQLLLVFLNVQAEITL